MKTSTRQLIRGLFATAALGLLTTAGHAQIALGTTGRHDDRHTRSHETPVNRPDHERPGHAKFNCDQMTTLPDIPGALDLVVIDINNRGQIIGVYFDEDYNAFGFLCERGVYTRLDFTPNRINDRGQIVGSTFDETTFLLHSFVYDRGIYTSIEFPGALEGGGFLTGINDRGQILGIYSDGRNDHGFIYDRGVYTALPDFPGARLTYPQSINNRGQIVGWAYDNNFVVTSFFYEKGIYTPLAAPGAIKGTYISDINDRGQILGIGTDAAYNTSSYVYEKGVYTVINLPEAQATYAYGLNDRGQIVGTYYDADFLPHGFVLNR